jgi:hypothetical protein
MPQVMASLDPCSDRPRLRKLGPGRSSGCCITHRPWRLALVDVLDSVAEAGGGAGRHTRAGSVSPPTVVADCRRLRYTHRRCRSCLVRRREVGGLVEVKRGAQSRRHPPLTQGQFDDVGNIGRQYRHSLASEPVARMWLVGGHHERCPGSVRMLDRKRAR